jgi:DNA-binding transcriptional ArsR family regulator
MLKQSRGPSTSAAAIVNHPLRSRVWHALVDTTASPAELARQFGQSVTDVAYHVRVLAEMGVIEKVRERPVRGAVESFWTSIQRPEISREEVAGMEPEDATANAVLTMQLSFADLTQSIDAGTFVERPEHIALRVGATFDEEGWEKVSGAYEKLLDLVYETEAESTGRLATDPDLPQVDSVAIGFLLEKPSKLR